MTSLIYPFENQRWTSVSIDTCLPFIVNMLSVRRCLSLVGILTFIFVYMFASCRVGSPIVHQHFSTNIKPCQQMLQHLGCGVIPVTIHNSQAASKTFKHGGFPVIILSLVDILQLLPSKYLHVFFNKWFFEMKKYQSPSSTDIKHDPLKAPQSALMHAGLWKSG